jgi:hypothetical protein
LNDSVISVETSGSGRLVMPSLPAGRAPDSIRVNGMFGVVGEDGTIASYADVSADVSIDAHGGTVPAVSGKTVSIDSADGPVSEKVSLGSALTEVGVLRQNQSVDKAVVAMNAGDNLAAGVIVVSPGAKPLELSAAGAATVAGIGGAPV